MRGVVFVHGALVRDGEWWWRPVAERLEAEGGVTSRAVLLPSCGETAAPAGSAGLADDAAALRDTLDEFDEAVVVGHSYGGTVIAEGADHPAVRHLVYISSYLPDTGEAQGGIMADEPDPVRVAMTEDGCVRVDGLDEAAFAARFLNDVPDESVPAEAWSRVVPQGFGAFATPTTGAAWQGRESTALVCLDDMGTSVGLQRRHAARATHAVELPTGHHPFLSRPDLVASELSRILRSL
ncbi:pimeloyl-ACP methyl ester carboxylesterase [Frondihabitans australicus]|uniref:Pimeloyl-ACP methyl ester carboxylesterase n=2 Tax=Frondihabitans australicus TaxID=386892 RepID=A0A495IBP2_9MICO|nr:pimeloyl-ACP methyl ester carboxylesterase [Frondihabitans australicus]